MFRTWALASLGLVAFAVLVWFAGPLLVIAGQAPLASPAARMAVVLIFTLQYLAQKVWSAWRARQKNERVVAALAPEAKAASSAEAAQLREHFATALAEMRSARLGSRAPWQFGRSRLHQLPWYVMLGAPGAGKTTALLNSGLHFPLADKLGRGPVKGIGGTRHCDWWFTDRAVFLDTAGRYTTHESDRVADANAWLSFLQLLLRTRPRRPLDGILVAVSVDDVLGFRGEQLSAHAEMLRTRLDELQSALRTRLPVYVLLTKCDLLPGFLDWFGALPRKQRDQAWGFTLDSNAANFADSFDQLVDRLADALVERMQAERDGQRRARIYSLPGQLRALQEPLEELVRTAFGSAHGLYLTSATQGGTPIDRILSAFGRELGLERQILPANQSTGTSFFLTGLLNDVVLAEAAPSGPRKRWQRSVLAASIVSVLVLAGVVGASWVATYFRSVREMARFESEVQQMAALAAAMPAAVDADPRPLLPALNLARDLLRARAQTGGPMELLDIGARAERKLAAAALAAYNRMLLGPFQSRIALAIDATMRSGADPNVQYEALKSYEMLNDAEHFDAAGFRVFVTSFWDSSLTPALQPTQRRDLAGHLDALLQAGAVGSGIKADPALVQSVRSRLSSQPSAQRIALRLAVALDRPAFADFSVASVGPAVAALFVGADGTSEPRRVPGRYTIAAYRDVVTTQVPAFGAQLAAEASWVLGATQARSPGDVAEVIADYRAAYTEAWGRTLADLRLKPATDEQAKIRQAEALSAPDGPLVRLLSEIVRQTPLRLENGVEGPITPTDPVADEIVALGDLLARDSEGGAALNRVLQSFKELQALHATGMQPERLSRIVAAARLEPEPVRSMLLALSEPRAADPRSTVSTVSPVQTPASAGGISRRVAARLGVPCIQLIAGRFPFDRRAERDASFNEFAMLFGPQGGFEVMFGEVFGSRVERSAESWRWIGPGTEPAEQELERFRAAARIRDVFFARGGALPGFQLTFRPIDLHEEIDRFQLDIDGQTVRYAHGPPLPTVIKWPGAQGKARIEVTPANLGAPVEFTGPWALFRLLDRAAVSDAGAPGRLRVVFDIGGRKATFEVETDVRANPFRLRELERFSCPIAGR